MANHPQWNSGKTGAATEPYTPTENDKVLLDYAQTAQRRADPWKEFEAAANAARVLRPEPTE